MEQSPNRDTKGKKTNKGRKEGSGQIENGHTRWGKKKKSIVLCLSCFYFYGERRLPSHAVGKKIIRSIPYMLLFFFLNGYRGLRSGSRRTRKRREIRKGVGGDRRKERTRRERATQENVAYDFQLQNTFYDTERYTFQWFVCLVNEVASNRKEEQHEGNRGIRELCWTATLCTYE